MREPRSQGPLRQGARRRLARFYRHRQRLPAADIGSELTIDTSARSVPDATDEIERMLAQSGILFDELVDLAANI